MSERDEAVAEETVIIRFQGDATSVEKAASDAERAVGGLDKAAKSAGGGFDVLGEIATGAMRRIGEAAIGAIGSGLSMLGDVITDSIAEAQEFQSVFAQTQAVVESTGMAAGFTAEEFAGLASDLSAANGLSLFSDDAILGATNVLATFKEIKGTTFEDATQAILDVSQAMGTDLQSSAIQVGKALNDPIGGISALSRVGIQFTADQKAMIEGMVEAGDVAGAQAIIIDELNSQFGGSAAAAVNTYAGQMKVLEEQFNDVKQQLGDALLPIMQQFGEVAVTYLVPAAQSAADAVIAFIGSFGQIDAFALTDSAIATVTSTMDTLRSAFDTALGAIMGQVNIFWGIVGPIWTQFVGVLSDAYTQLAPLGEVAKTAFGDIATEGEKMAPIGEFLGNIVKAVLNVAGILVQVLVPIIKFVFPLIVDYIQQTIQNFISLYNTIQYVFSGELQRDITSWWTSLINNIITTLTGFIARVRQLGADIANGIAQGIQSAAGAIKDAFARTIGDAIAFAKRILGIASPSKLFADAIGVPIGQGIAAGIVRASGDVASAMGASVGSAVGATQQTIQNFYLTANYATAQSQSDLMSDVRAMQLLAGGV
jgi:phage-related protein